jgi:hypothetical protein
MIFVLKILKIYRVKVILFSASSGSGMPGATKQDEIYVKFSLLKKIARKKENYPMQIF